MARGPTKAELETAHELELARLKRYYASERKQCMEALRVTALRAERAELRLLNIIEKFNLWMKGEFKQDQYIDLIIAITLDMAEEIKSRGQ